MPSQPFLPVLPFLWPRSRTQFLCNHCGSVHPKWMGKCPDCGTWDSLEEYKAPDRRRARRRADAAPAAGRRRPDRRPRPRRRGPDPGRDRRGRHPAPPLRHRRVRPRPRRRRRPRQRRPGRRRAGHREIHPAAAGGARAGEGQDARAAGDKATGEARRADSTPPARPCPGPPPCKVLYVTSEESARQTKLRAARLGVEAPDLLVLAETNVERIINQIHKQQPDVVVIDSIQMIYKPDLPAAPGRSRSCATAAWTWSTWPRPAASR